MKNFTFFLNRKFDFEKSVHLGRQILAKCQRPKKCTSQTPNFGKMSKIAHLKIKVRIEKFISAHRKF